MSIVPQAIIDRVRAECIADGRPWPAAAPPARSTARIADLGAPGVDIDAVHRNPRWTQVPTAAKIHPYTTAAPARKGHVNCKPPGPTRPGV